MTAADLRLTSDQETALRESTETGCWYPATPEDFRVARYLTGYGLFVPRPWRTLWEQRAFEITAAGRDWLALHPTEVAR